MTSDDFRAWMSHMGAQKGKERLSEREASEVLGWSRMAVRNALNGKDPPRYIALACAAAAFGLPEWRKP